MIVCVFNIQEKSIQSYCLGRGDGKNAHNRNNFQARTKQNGVKNSGASSSDCPIRMAFYTILI